jgi:FkbM family methyltransferase
VASPAFLPLHDPAEWVALLKSALEARKSFTVVELGAGFGPWLVAGARAVRHLGIEDVCLIGAEAAASHYRFMLQHFRDNGLKPEAHRLFHAAVGPQDGTVAFPDPVDPSADWGAAMGSGDPIKCISLRSLMEGVNSVDLLHCDIQGAELETLSASREILARIKRLVIGTHSRQIEASLLDLFAGWRLETEKPCQIEQNGSGFRLVRDGVQVWTH